MLIPSAVPLVSELDKAIMKTIEDAVTRAKEVAIKRAVADYEAELREAVGRSAIRLSDYYQIETGMKSMVITIFKDRKSAE